MSRGRISFVIGMMLLSVSVFMAFTTMFSVAMFSMTFTSMFPSMTIASTTMFSVIMSSHSRAHTRTTAMNRILVTRICLRSWREVISQVFLHIHILRATKVIQQHNLLNLNRIIISTHMRSTLCQPWGKGMIIAKVFQGILVFILHCLSIQGNLSTGGHTCHLTSTCLPILRDSLGQCRFGKGEDDLILALGHVYCRWIDIREVKDGTTRTAGEGISIRDGTDVTKGVGVGVCIGESRDGRKEGMVNDPTTACGIVVPGGNFLIIHGNGINL
mmetsp:Transcript_11758/g.17810  ORF Transcript_11758/g.17810 Transcript_11758/m.17810 type:complete len:272 (+) Transcript_11758:478-1293(+)